MRNYLNLLLLVWLKNSLKNYFGETIYLICIKHSIPMNTAAPLWKQFQNIQNSFICRVKRVGVDNERINNFGHFELFWKYDSTGIEKYRYILTLHLLILNIVWSK